MYRKLSVDAAFAPFVIRLSLRPHFNTPTKFYYSNMATKIRLQRFGRKGYAFYQVVIADSRAPRDGKFIERIGSYNPNTNPATIDLNFDRALYWLQVGAQPTDTARMILSREGVCLKKHLLEGVKKGAFDEAKAEEKFQAWLSKLPPPLRLPKLRLRLQRPLKHRPLRLRLPKPKLHRHRKPTKESTTRSAPPRYRSGQAYKKEVSDYPLCGWVGHFRFMASAG